MNYVHSSINFYSYYLPTLVHTDGTYRALLGYDVMSYVVLKVNNPQGDTVPSAVYVAAAANRLYNTTPKMQNEPHRCKTLRSDEYVKSMKVDASTDHFDSLNKV